MGHRVDQPVVRPSGQARNQIMRRRYKKNQSKLTYVLQSRQIFYLAILLAVGGILFLLFTVVSPLYDLWSNDYFHKILSTPQFTLKKELLSSSDFKNVYHFSDELTEIFSDSSSQFITGSLTLAAGGLIALILSVVSVIKCIRQNNTKNLLQVLFIIFWGVFWVRSNENWMRLALEDYNYSVKKYEESLNYQLTGDYQVVEGSIRILHQYPPEGHSRGDILVVGDEKFEIHPRYNSFYYDEPIVKGGILTSGKYVRLFHKDGKILAIDVMR